MVCFVNVLWGMGLWGLWVGLGWVGVRVGVGRCGWGCGVAVRVLGWVGVGLVGHHIYKVSK